MNTELERKPGAFRMLDTDLDWPSYDVLKPVLVIARDDFNRADGVLGAALTGQPWEILGSVYPVGISRQQIARTGSGAAGDRVLAVVDSGRADCTINAALSTMPTSANTASCGVAFRVQDEQNFYYLSLRVSANELRLSIFKREAGAVTSVTAPFPGIVPAAGQAYQIRLVGTSVDISVDGVPFTTSAVPLFTGATKHGFIFTGTADAAFDGFELTV